MAQQEPNQEELELLREESESLAAFLVALQREYRQLQADFAAVLLSADGHVRVSAAEVRAVADVPRIERLEDPATGAVTFVLMPAL